MVARKDKRFEDAITLFEQSMKKLARAGNIGHQAMSISKLGLVYSDQGDNESAVRMIEEAITLLEETPEQFFLSTAYLDLARIYKKMGEQKRGKDAAKKSLDLLNGLSTEDEFTERRKEIQTFILQT